MRERSIVGSYGEVGKVLTRCGWQAVETLKSKERMVRMVLSRWQTPGEHVGFTAWLEHMEMVREERRKGSEQELIGRLEGQIKVRQRSLLEAQALTSRLERSEEEHEKTRRELDGLRTEHGRVQELVKELEGDVSGMAMEVRRGKAAMLEASRAAIVKERAEAADMERVLRTDLEAVRRKVGELEVLSEDRGRESEENRLKAMKEMERRLDMGRKVIARMGHIEVANAFDHLRERVEDKKQRSAASQRVLRRMIHLQVARAFDRFAHAAEGLRVQRLVLSRTIGRWWKPLLAWAFEGLVAGVEEARAEAAERAREAGREEVAEQLRRGSEQVSEGGEGEIAGVQLGDRAVWQVAEEVKRRVEMSGRVVRRMTGFMPLMPTGRRKLERRL